ncbi:MAG TPA: hypothetical protein VLQ93_14695, partial [Myxococcaceae bacterium]|nr:hypothetical protein [Myxococcaceae bacterium]
MKRFDTAKVPASNPTYITYISKTGQRQQRRYMELNTKRLQLWLDEALRHVTPQAPQHLHIDQLGTAGATGEAALSLASEAYAFVLERMGDSATDIKAVLFLPLHDSEALDPQP